MKKIDEFKQKLDLMIEGLEKINCNTKTLLQEIEHRGGIVCNDSVTAMISTVPTQEEIRQMIKENTEYEKFYTNSTQLEKDLYDFVSKHVTSETIKRIEYTKELVDIINKNNGKAL